MTDNITVFPSPADRADRLKARSLLQLAPLMPAILDEIAPMLDEVAARERAELPAAEAVDAEDADPTDEDHCVVTVRPSVVRDLVAQYAFCRLEEIYGRDDPRCLEAYEECATGGPALEHWTVLWLEEMDERPAVEP